GRGAQERSRRQGGGRQDEGAADGRQAVRQGHGACRRPQDPPDVLGRGEEAGGIEGPVGLLQGPRHHSGRSGLPAAVGRRLPAREQKLFVTRVRGSFLTFLPRNASMLRLIARERADEGAAHGTVLFPATRFKVVSYLPSAARRSSAIPATIGPGQSM